MENRHNKKWTREEDKKIVYAVRHHPWSMNYCFLAVGAEIGRTATSVAARWYSKVSHDPKNAAIIVLTPVSKCLNRKNSKGNTSRSSMFWQVMKMLQFS